MTVPPFVFGTKEMATFEGAPFTVTDPAEGEG